MKNVYQFVVVVLGGIGDGWTAGLAGRRTTVELIDDTCIVGTIAAVESDMGLAITHATCTARVCCGPRAWDRDEKAVSSMLIFGFAHSKWIILEWKDL